MRVKRVDHAEAASEFIASKEHVDFHDHRLWDLRKKRDRETEAIAEWEELRSLASAIKENTLSHLADYLQEFERNAIINGVKVHWAVDATEHNELVLEILRSRGAKTLVKAKSMLTEASSSTTSRRVTSWCHRCTSCVRMSRRSLRARSEPTATTAIRTISPKASARTRGRTSCAPRPV